MDFEIERSPMDAKRDKLEKPLSFLTHFKVHDRQGRIKNN
jgi:hypothetical protein